MKFEKNKLGEIAKYINGRAFKPSEWKENGKPIIRIQNLNNPQAKFNFSDIEHEEKYLVKKGDLLFAWSASLGAFIWNGNDGWLNQHIFKVIPEKNTNKLYLFYLLQRIVAELYTKAHGSGMVHVTKNKFEATPVPLPPLPVQQAIVEKLEALFSELDKGIEQLKTAQQQLRIYRQAVLKAAFEGRLTGEQMKQGELPEGWSSTTIGELFEVFVGATPSRSISTYWNGDIPWVSSGEIAFCQIRSTRENISLSGLTNSSCKIHPPGTILLAMIGEGKTRGQAAILKIEATHNQNTAAIRINPEKYLSEFMYHYLVFKYEANRRVGSGNNQKALNKERVKSIEIPLLPLPAQRQIVSAIESRLSVADKLEETIAENLKQAEALRQSILKKAFEGELAS